MLALILALLLPSAAYARCPELYGAIREEARSAYGTRLSCDEVRHAASLLPLEEGSRAAGEWSFRGEQDLRGELKDRRGIYIPPDILPIGYVEREAPGGSGAVVVFGLRMPDRLRALVRLADQRIGARAPELAAQLGEGVPYDRVGFYVEEDGRYPDRGRWLPMERGGLWGVSRPAPKAMRLCGGCRGWLCPEGALACFSDFNADGSEEIHLTDDCRDGRCGLAVFEARRGRAELLFNGALREADWKDRPEGWALVPEPECRGRSFCAGEHGSLGDPSCTRPRVYLFRRGSHRIVPSEPLRDAFYPVSRRRAPSGCRMQDRSRLVYSHDSGFVLYEK